MAIDPLKNIKQNKALQYKKESIEQGKGVKLYDVDMAIVDREPMNVVYEGFGADKQQAVEFRFNIQRLRETSHSVPKIRDVNGTLIPTEAIQNTTVGFPEIGDVILFDGIYYEIDNIRENQLIGGQPQIYDKNTNTFEDSSNTLIGVGFMVRRSQIQIDERIYH